MQTRCHGGLCGEVVNVCVVIANFASLIPFCPPPLLPSSRCPQRGLCPRPPAARSLPTSAVHPPPAASPPRGGFALLPPAASQSAYGRGRAKAPPACPRPGGRTGSTSSPDRCRVFSEKPTDRLVPGRPRTSRGNRLGGEGYDATGRRWWKGDRRPPQSRGGG